MRNLASRIQNIRPSGIRKYFDVKQEDLISLGSGTIDWDTFDHIHAAAAQALDEDFTAYTTNSGILPLRQAVTEKLERDNGIIYGPDEILVTCGSSEAMAAIPLAVLEPGDEALIFDPAYSAFAPLTELANGRPVLVPTRPEDNWNPDPDLVRKAITPRTRLMWLNSPGNPTGAVLTRETTEALAELAIEHDLWVISDELYERIVFDGKQVVSPASLPGMRERTFTINGFSKAFGMTGWRVGYVAAPGWLIEALIKAQQYASICPPSLSQRAALGALIGPKEQHQRMMVELDRRRRFVADSLNEVEGLCCVPQDGTFYTFVDARDLLAEKANALRAFLEAHAGQAPDEPDEQLTDYLLLRGNVALTAGSAFGPAGAGFFRVSEAGQMKLLEKGMARIQEAVAAL
jgi:aspartate/methionine/tyrosine aminotransferase